jgi:hypothetical protein
MASDSEQSGNGAVGASSKRLRTPRRPIGISPTSIRENAGVGAWIPARRRPAGQGVVSQTVRTSV